MGLAIDPGFAANGWLYLFYSKAGAEPKNVLARYTMRGDSVDTSNAIVMFRGGGAARAVLSHRRVDRLRCQGNLFCRPGTIPTRSWNGYAPSMSARGVPWDAQKSSANTNDLRGKILRIHPGLT
ncbi:MAG: hypothetical protein IPK33_33325 [Gemmatimonadetes bacterium]|nr:hypothetical protein [Gemmatimonadota bacterium]